MTTANKIDSNSTGLSIAYETQVIGVLPGTPIWYPLEPNTYSDFGPTIKTTPRNPITVTRQQKKGTTTDLDAAAGWNQDVTQNNMTRHLQSFFFAALREKPTTQPMNSAAIVLTAVDSILGYEAAAGLGIFVANDLLLASGFGVTANNGLKVVSTASGTAVVTVPASAVEASPPAASGLKKVGVQFPSGDISFALNGNLSRIVSASNALAQLELIPGEWVYVGSDTTTHVSATQFGFARVSVVTAGYLELDKTDWTPAVDAGTGKTIQIYNGDLLRTEEDPANQKRFTGTLERSLSNAGTGAQAQYVIGAVANTMALNMPGQNKVTVDLSYMGIDGPYRDGATGIMPGTRLPLVSTDAYNTSSDFSRIKMSIVDPTTSKVSPLFAYVTDLTLNISNNVTSNKALGILGAFDMSAGIFAFTGKATAYFGDVDSLLAVRNNTSVTLDIVLVKNNSGMLFDVPLVTLGGALLAVEADKAITVPLDITGAESVFNHTTVYQNFLYLPSAAG